jgi:hypothetical protein
MAAETQQQIESNLCLLAANKCCYDRFISSVQLAQICSPSEFRCPPLYICEGQQEFMWLQPAILQFARTLQQGHFPRTVLHRERTIPNRDTIHDRFYILFKQQSSS